MNNQTTELQDNLVLLRPFTLADAQTHVENDDEENIKWLNEGHKSTMQTTTDWIIRNQESWEEGGPVYSFAIVEKATNQLMGMIEANTNREKIKELEPGDANISYNLYPKARGKGYMKHAMSLVLQFLKQKGITRAVIRVDKENIKSLNVAKRSHFSHQGSYTEKDGHTFEVFRKKLD